MVEEKKGSSKEDWAEQNAKPYFYPWLVINSYKPSQFWWWL